MGTADVRFGGLHVHSSPSFVCALRSRCILPPYLHRATCLSAVHEQHSACWAANAGKNCTGSVTAANITFSDGSSISVTSGIRFSMSAATGVLNVSQALTGVETTNTPWTQSWLRGSKLCVQLAGSCPTISSLCSGGSCKSFVTVKCTAQKTNLLLFTSYAYEWACGTKNTSGESMQGQLH